MDSVSLFEVLKSITSSMNTGLYDRVNSALGIMMNDYAVLRCPTMVPAIYWRGDRQTLKQVKSRCQHHPLLHLKGLVLLILAPKMLVIDGTSYQSRNYTSTELTIEAYTSTRTRR